MWPILCSKKEQRIRTFHTVFAQTIHSVRVRCLGWWWWGWRTCSHGIGRAELKQGCQTGRVCLNLEFASMQCSSSCLPELAWCCAISYKSQINHRLVESASWWRFCLHLCPYTATATTDTLRDLIAGWIDSALTSLIHLKTCKLSKTPQCICARLKSNVHPLSTFSPLYH